MLPVVKGEAATRRQIVVYTLILVAFTLPRSPPASSAPSTPPPRSSSAPASSLLAVRLLRHPARAAALRLYLSSLAYLALLFCAMAVDAVL